MFRGNINERLSAKASKPVPDTDYFVRYNPRLLQKKVGFGMEKIIPELSKNYLLFIVSSSDTKAIRTLLEENNILKCFREIYGNDIHKSKVVKIKMILEKYRLGASDCLFITDTLGDILEARACDMDSITVSWGYHNGPMLLEGKPLAVLSSPDELINTIEEHSS